MTVHLPKCQKPMWITEYPAFRVWKLSIPSVSEHLSQRVIGTILPSELPFFKVCIKGYIKFSDDVSLNTSLKHSFCIFYLRFEIRHHFKQWILNGLCNKYCGSASKIPTSAPAHNLYLEEVQPWMKTITQVTSGMEIIKHHTPWKWPLNIHAIHCEHLWRW